MSDLSAEGSAKFWYDFDDPMIYRVVTFMAGVENWILEDDPAMEAALTELGKQIDDIGKIEFETLERQKDIVEICNHVSTTRGLRLLQAIDSASPGSASKLLIHAEEKTQDPEDAEGLFLRRNIVFERLRLLGRVFSEERFKLVLRALEGEEEL